MTHYLIALSRSHPDAPPAPDKAYWCGYRAQGKTHLWRRGHEGRERAIRFCRVQDAHNAGVSGPNVPNRAEKDQPQFQHDRGIEIVEVLY